MHGAAKRFAIWSLEEKQSEIHRAHQRYFNQTNIKPVLNLHLYSTVPCTVQYGIRVLIDKFTLVLFSPKKYIQLL